MSWGNGRMHTTADAMSDRDACQYIIDLVYDRCRIRLHNGKEALIKARLGKRLRARGFTALADYCGFLQSSGDEQELTQVVDSLTTNFTSFFREQDHFRVLVEEALSPERLGGRKRARVWSAACSSGEEPYSIAIYLAEYFPPVVGWDWAVTASDISTRMLEKARAGIYPKDRLQTVPREWLHKYFQQGTGRFAAQCRVKPSLSQRVSFRQINLVEPYEHPEAYEVIFCRNVMIYFDRTTQAQLVRQLCRFLVPGGYLLIGHSESLNGLELPLRCLRPSVYQRTAP